MITAKLQGGLGNQMFQISTAYALARDNGVRCGFNFRVPVVHQGNTPMTYRDSLYRELVSLPHGWRPRFVFRERPDRERSIMFMDNMSIEGYFQKEDHFVRYADEIRALFIDDRIKDDLMLEWGDKLQNSVSLHIRRGDYLKFSNVYYSLGEGYYQKAMRLIEQEHKVDNIFVMSDDVLWCRDNIKDKRAIFLSDRPDHYDMILMSMCSHNVIANSSFSWWGAWIGERRGKVIIAPGLWCKGCAFNPIPKRWIRL